MCTSHHAKETLAHTHLPAQTVCNNYLSHLSEDKGLTVLQPHPLSVAHMSRQPTTGVSSQGFFFLASPVSSPEVGFSSHPPSARDFSTPAPLSAPSNHHSAGIRFHAVGTERQACLCCGTWSKCPQRYWRRSPSPPSSCPSAQSAVTTRTSHPSAASCRDPWSPFFLILQNEEVCVTREVPRRVSADSERQTPRRVRLPASDRTPERTHRVGE